MLKTDSAVLMEHSSLLLVAQILISNYCEIWLRFAILVLYKVWD